MCFIKYFNFKFMFLFFSISFSFPFYGILKHHRTGTWALKTADSTTWYPIMLKIEHTNDNSLSNLFLSSLNSVRKSETE